MEAAADRTPSEELLTELLERFGSNGQHSLSALRDLLISGVLCPQTNGRYYVALSLAEAETIRKILHVRQRRPSPVGGSEVALRYSLIPSPGSPSAGDGGIVFDISAGWKSEG